MLSTAAFNALLKTLEEPPPHVKFIFATTESQKVLPTIISRCQRFEFRPISEDVIVERLGQISESESIQASEESLRAVARLANGGMRDAQSILDQMISFCGTQIEEADVLDVYGLVSAATIEQLAKALVAADYPKIVAMVGELAAEGRDLFRVLQDLETRIREAMLDAIRHKGTTESLGKSLSVEALLRMLESLQRSEYSVQKGLSEKVNFEVALLKAVDASRTRAIDSLIKELSHMVDGVEDSAAKKKA